MKVYVVTLYDECEGNVVIGVCTTRKQAFELMEKDISEHQDYFKGDDNPRSSFEFEEFDLITE